MLSVTGHLRGRRSSAGCRGRRCCSNVLRELASFVSDRPTQLQLRVFIYTKTAVKSHIHEEVPANCCTCPVTHRHQCIFQEDLEIPSSRPQQHQITMIYLGCPYSSIINSITTYIYFLFPILHPDQLHCCIAACSICRKDAGERTGVQHAKKASASCVTPCLRRGTLYDHTTKS